jgi:predicted nucleotide-binding protein
MAVDDARVNEATSILETMGQKVVSVKRANNVGYAIRTRSGATINLWDKGTISCQGNYQQKMVEALAHLDFHYSDEKAPPPRNVLVVYGHDEAARTELDALLRKWDLTPILLDQEPSKGLTLIEKLEAHQPRASYGIVLLTPDDVGYAKEHEANKQYRARQNVILELGMLLGSLGRANVAILYKGPIELPSDIGGFVYIPFTAHVNEASVQLIRELNSAGLTIDSRRL